MKTEIELFDDVIEIEIDYRWDNDSMDYEWWGSKESIKGDDYPVIETIIWDMSKYTPEQNEQIELYVYSDEIIEKLDKKLSEYLKNY